MADHPVETKSILQSKTFYMNVFAFVAALGALFGLDLEVDPKTLAIILAVVIPLANVGMRYFTSKAIRG